MGIYLSGMFVSDTDERERRELSKSEKERELRREHCFDSNGITEWW